VKDNEPRLPSVVLCELLDYIVENYSLSKDSLTTVHPLQAFSWKYFVNEDGANNGLISYSAENAKLAKLRFEKFKEDNFADSELNEIPEELYRIDLDDLCDFFINPAKYFLQKCLQVYPQIRDLPELADCENFEIESGLESYTLADSIIKKYLPEWNKYDKNELKEILQKRFHAEGVLPAKAWGDIEFDKFFEKFSPFAEKISSVITNPMETVSKEHNFDNGIMLQASFDDFYIVGEETKQIQFKYSNVKSKAKHLIRASLYELAANAMKVVPENGASTV
jgi:exodeoxyribonuclease V gamma subunit